MLLKNWCVFRGATAKQRATTTETTIACRARKTNEQTNKQTADECDQINIWQFVEADKMAIDADQQGPWEGRTAGKGGRQFKLPA